MDFGPSEIDPGAGAVIVGARPPLIAFNVNLRAPLEVAREVATVVRESGGGFPGLRALGLRPGDRVILQLERTRDFIPGFWGCVLGGFVPSPIGVAPTYGERNAVLYVWSEGRQD